MEEENGRIEGAWDFSCHFGNVHNDDELPMEVGFPLCEIMAVPLFHISEKSVGKKKSFALQSCSFIVVGQVGLFLAAKGAQILLLFILLREVLYEFEYVCLKLRHRINYLLPMSSYYSSRRHDCLMAFQRQCGFDPFGQNYSLSTFFPVA